MSPHLFSFHPRSTPPSNLPRPPSFGKTSAVILNPYPPPPMPPIRLFPFADLAPDSLFITPDITSCPKNPRPVSAFPRQPCFCLHALILVQPCPPRLHSRSSGLPRASLPVGMFRTLFARQGTRSALGRVCSPPVHIFPFNSRSSVFIPRPFNLRDSRRLPRDLFCPEAHSKSPSVFLLPSTAPPIPALSLFFLVLYFPALLAF